MFACPFKRILIHKSVIQPSKTKQVLLLHYRCSNTGSTFFGNDVLGYSLNKKEAYLSKKKQTTELCKTWNPQFVSAHTKKINQCKSGDDIMNTLKQIENELNLILDTKQYVTAIRKAASLHEYSVCFKIFEIAKTLQRVDVYLYTAMIWICCQQRSVSSLNNGLKLFVEMQEVYLLTPSIDIYNQLLSLCVKTLEYSKAKHIWKELKDSTNNVSSPNISTYNIMIELYCKCGEIHKAVEIFEDLCLGKYGDSLKPNYVIYSTLMNGFGKHKKIENVEQLFDSALKNCYMNTKEHNDNNRKQLVILTQILLDAYANTGNVDKCVQIITDVMQKSHPQYDWTYFPEPNAQMFTSVLKALTRYKMTKNDDTVSASADISHETCWTIIDWCLECMQVLNIKKDAVVYGNLFHLCGNLYGSADLNKALEFYQEMKDNNIKAGELQIFNLLKTGKQYHHERKSNSSERKEFVQYILSQVEEHNIVASPQLRKLVKQMMVLVNKRDNMIT